MYAAWLRFGREVEEVVGRRVTQRWSDDDIVVHLHLDIAAARPRDVGGYVSYFDWIIPNKSFFWGVEVSWHSLLPKSSPLAVALCCVQFAVP